MAQINKHPVYRARHNLPRVDMPVITDPGDGDDVATFTPTLTTSAFSTSVQVDTHATSDWQIATDPNFSVIVLNVAASAVSLVSLAVPALTLHAGTLFFVRVRHRGALLGVSAWSRYVRFRVVL